jgi:tRNA/rRNA methyltransferase
MPGTERASREEIIAFFEHLEHELDDCGFLRPPEKRASMVRNIRNLFQRAGLTEQEVRTLRGIVAGLTKWHKGIKREH